MSRQTLVIARIALRLAERIARRTSNREVGGLLLGFRSGEGVHVEDVISVPDPQASRTRFVLRETAREDALRRYSGALPTSSPIGYVGTWHSHPAHIGPSWVDRQTFRREVWFARDTVALVVLASGTSGWYPIGLVGLPPLWVRRADVQVV